jgi:hypothetical protein
MCFPFCGRDHTQGPSTRRRRGPPPRPLDEVGRAGRRDFRLDPKRGRRLAELEPLITGCPVLAAAGDRARARRDRRCPQRAMISQRTKPRVQSGGAVGMFSPNLKLLVLSHGPASRRRKPSIVHTRP